MGSVQLNNRPKKLNLKQQIRKSVQRLSRSNKRTWAKSVQKLKHLGFENSNLTIPRFNLKSNEIPESVNQISQEEGELDESIKTKKKFMSKQYSRDFIIKKKKKKLKDKLKKQTRSNKSKLKKKIFTKISDPQLKKGAFISRQAKPKNPKLKSYIYDNAIVNKNSKTQEGIILFESGEVYYGNLNYQNRPNGTGILFSNQGEFVYGNFTCGLLNGKAITNDTKYMRRTTTPNQNFTEESKIL